MKPNLDRFHFGNHYDMEFNCADPDIKGMLDPLYRRLKERAEEHVAYLLIDGQYTASARAALARDPEWAAPLVWRSEFRNVIALYLRQRHLSLADAVIVCATAEGLLAGREHLVSSRDVLALAHESGRSAYDCKCVALRAS